MKRSGPPTRRTPLKRGTKRLRRRSPGRDVKIQKADEFFQDCKGVWFHEVEGLMGPVARWPRVRIVERRETIIVFKRRFCVCFWCGRQGGWDDPEGAPFRLDPHHIVAGSRGRSDELCNLMPLCRKCHELIQSDASLFGRVLWLKWSLDRETVDWCRLALLRGRALGELTTE